MLTVSVYLLLWSFTASSSGVGASAQCQPGWLLYGRTCFAFFPVWSSWTSANTLCSQTGGNLMLLHRPEERQIVLQLTSSRTPVWLGRYQNRSRIWSDDSLLHNRMDEKTKEFGLCMEMIPKTGELQSAPCGELRFYICTASPRFTSVDLSRHKLPQPGLVPGLLLFDFIWDSSSHQAEKIFLSSSLLRGLRSGNLTERCYNTFLQQEETYLLRVKSTLEVLVGSLHEHSTIRSLLLDTVRRYGAGKQSLHLSSPAPQWLQWALKSFHRVVLDDPVYWLVALSARACLQDFVAQKLHQELGSQVPSLKENNFYQMWRRENEDFVWVKRFKAVMEEYQDEMDAYKATAIFREHMMYQKSLHNFVSCEDEGDEEIHIRADVL
ncbi:uncharacterized protein LOC106952671 [Poecilia latipinna]|uniref:uncharacterized protein LOC106952671 n=1 Tax=Poecilia latipinna TaxID=48699 RepID=UPI00072EBE5A|nr:PREDICTED: uncharacterized protein LOC106952671 [Poecilia latipinna]